MEAQRPPQPKAKKPFLAQMDFSIGGGEEMQHLRLRFYPTENADDPRPFIAKDLEGREVKLTPEQEESAKPYVFPKR